MSRIIHGSSDEIKTVQAVRPRQSAPSQYRTAKFSAYAISGALTEEEIQGKLATARLEGASEAERRIQEPLRTALENVEKFLDELTLFRRELFRESEEDVLEMIQVVARKVVLRELMLDPALMKQVVEKAISLMEKQKRVSLAVNPRDLQFYQAAKPDFLAKFQGLTELRIEANSSVPPGAVMVGSQKVELDVRLDAMVDQLMTQIKAARSPVAHTNDEGDSA